VLSSPIPYQQSFALAGSDRRLKPIGIPFARHAPITKSSFDARDLVLRKDVAVRGVEVMSSSFRARSADGGSIAVAMYLDDLIEAVKAAIPGCYRIDKISFDSTTGTGRSWEYGSITKRRDGAIELELPPLFD
jgi:hypothetical protein